MRQPFYRPYSAEFYNIPAIVYPANDADHHLDSAYVPPNMSGVTDHLVQLYRTNLTRLELGSYHIVFAWALSGVAMTDVWIHDLENPSITASGPLVNCEIFSGIDPSQDVGVASGDTLIVLGREAELQRRLVSVDYLNRDNHMPTFEPNFYGDSYC